MIVYTIKQDKCGLWSVFCASVKLADGLLFVPTNMQARDTTRAEHLESSLTTRVVIQGADAIVCLANYQTLQDTWTGATA